MDLYVIAYFFPFLIFGIFCNHNSLKLMVNLFWILLHTKWLLHIYTYLDKIQNLLYRYRTKHLKKKEGLK